MTTIDITDNVLNLAGFLGLVAFGIALYTKRRTGRYDAQRIAWQAWREVALASLALGKDAPPPPSDGSANAAHR